MKTAVRLRTSTKLGSGRLDASSGASGLGSVIETLFIAVSVAFVYASYLVQMPSFGPWLGLLAAASPLLVRLYRYGYRSLRTPFDIPIAILIAGGIVGLAVSPMFHMSLGAFQTLLGLACLYYSIATARYPSLLMKAVLVIFFLFTLAAAVFALGRGHLPPDSLVVTSPWLNGLVQDLPKLPEVSSQPNLAVGANHGLALALAIVAAICAGLAIFGRHIWLRLGSGLTAILFLGGAALFINSALFRLADGESLEKRAVIWQKTVQILGDHPIAGLGLGYWAPLNNPKGLGWMTSHPHNAYLSLYADFGILGVLSLLVALIVAARLAWGILRSPRSSPWYGLGIGVLLAGVVTLLASLVESAPASVPLVAHGVYFYVVSPAGWFMAAFLVAAHRLTRSNIPGRREAG